MILLVKTVFVIVVIAALIAAVWKILYDFFRGSILRVFGFLFSLLFLYFGWKLLWMGAPKDENKLLLHDIKEQYHVKRSIPSGTSTGRWDYQDSGHTKD